MEEETSDSDMGKRTPGPDMADMGLTPVNQWYNGLKGLMVPGTTLHSCYNMKSGQSGCMEEGNAFLVRWKVLHHSTLLLCLI